ncbi:DUF805 domain-containing protein [Limosilactobacillus sp.]|jgi:uncharacterized membrane protein YhaH (DUF805 family)|uniref:DUF805 domain-containing protein n=1 Tax=Limosilactobacillus sp. TaxID=2773925 RepID=UPI0025C21732|nr:DUF805 domain-containing protein [Limosilactobacillus sp.]MCI2031612.1 DUF805 domain-containing protein [Limosilactobacillus sp.]
MLKAYKYYWQNSFKYQATSSRADYWWPVLMNLIIYAILWLLLAASGVSSIGSLVNGTTQGLGMVLIIVVIMAAFGFANIFPEIAITVRRLRDVGISGWFLFAVWLVSIVLGNVNNEFCNGLMVVLEIVVLVFMCLPTNYVNKQGWWSPNKSNDQEISSLKNE